MPARIAAFTHLYLHVSPHGTAAANDVPTEIALAATCGDARHHRVGACVWVGNFDGSLLPETGMRRRLYNHTDPWPRRQLYRDGQLHWCGRGASGERRRMVG